MKRNFTFLMAAFALIVSMMMPLGMKGENRGVTTYTFTSKAWAATPANWTSGKDGNQMTSGRGVQVTTGVSGANATSPVSFSDVSKVEITYSTNSSSGAGSVVVQIGSNTSVSKTVTSSGGTSDRVLTFNYSEAQTGTVKFTVNCTTNSIYIKSISITHNSSSGGATTTVDVLNRDFTGITNTTYTDWTGTGASGTVYSGNSAGGNSSIQLRSSNLSGIVSTTSFGKVTNVVVTWNSNTAADRTLDIYGKNTAYTDASDLYNNSTRGTKLGSIVKGTSTTLDITGDYDYIGLRSNSGAMYLSEIQITWEVQAANPVATPTFSPAAGTYTEPQNVTLSCTTSDATIHYTTDGSTPSESSPTYSGVIAVSTTTTIKAIAVKSGMSNSAVATATYTIESSGGDGTVYTLYTGNLIEGDYIIYYSGKAMKNTVSSNRLQYETITPSGNTITTSDDAIIWHIAPSGDYWTIYNEAVGKFAASTGIENKAQLLDSGTDDMSLWTVEGNSTYEFVNKKNNANSVNDYLRNNGSYGFACYSSATGGALSLYRSTAPSIVVNQTIELAHDATSGAFGYSITNPVEGTNLQAISNAEWITNVMVGTEQVTFTATANTTGVERTGTITLQYDGAQDKTVTVTQAAIAPVLETTNVPSTPFVYTGGVGSFDFTITNPVEGATTTATSTNAWITNVAVSGNTVNFQVAPNNDVARSGNITLNYMSNGNTLATVTVTVDQEANPVLPGGADNPYTVAQAIQNTPSSGEVYVTGIVSKIYEIEVLQYHNARYVITDNGVYDPNSADTVMSYRGFYLHGDDFLSEDQLQLGDVVVIKGQLATYHSGSELAEGNYIVSLNRAVYPVTFNPVSCVTTPRNVSLFTESLNEWDAEIYYTTDGSDPRTNGTAFEDSWDAYLNVAQTTTIKAAAFIPDLNKWSGVTEATYTVVDPQSPGWEGNPYTVSQALAALDLNSDIKGAYVQGVVSQIDQIELTQYYNATYFISDNGQTNNELQVYRGKYISRADFTSLDQLLEGDQVTVFGDLTVYRGTTKEFKPKNYIENWYRPTSIRITPDHYDFSCNATSGLIDVIYSSDIQVTTCNPTVQFCDADGASATYNWLTVMPSQANEWDLEYIINANEGNAPRTAYLKVSSQDSESNDIVSNIISITQNEYQIDFATLDFYFNGGYDDIDNTPGLTGENLGSYAAVINNNPNTARIKFANASADQMSTLVLKINEAPGVLKYDIRGFGNGNYPGMIGGTFKLQESTNGITYSDVVTYSGLSESVQTDSVNNLSPNTRYIRWIYVTKNKGNVGVGNIILKKPIVHYDIVINNPTYGGEEIGTITTNVPMIAAEGTNVILNITYDHSAYYFVEWVVTDDSNNLVPVDNNHFSMPASDVTVTATLVGVDTPCTYAFSTNGQMGDQQSVTVGNAVLMPTCPDIAFNDQTFTFRGWTIDADNVTDLLRAGTNYTMMHDETFYAVYNQQVTDTEADKHYAKVTRELPDWSGRYLIVYEDGTSAFDGGLDPLDDAFNIVSVTISNDIISATETLTESEFTIAAFEGGYSIQSASGIYIGKTANSNGLNEDEEEAFVNYITYDVDNDEVNIVGSGGPYLRFNTNSDQRRFRYYKTSTYGQGIQLYRYVGSVSNLYTRIFMNETANNITIEGPSIIPDGSVLNVASITNNLGADRLLVDEGGQLVTSSDVNATVRKTITPYAEEHGTDNYCLIASPVNNLNPATAGMTGANFDLYAFDQEAQGEEWQNYKVDDFNLAAGQGYLYANDYGGFINMGGTMAATADSVTITEVSGKPFGGWNLIGNPYPCNVTIGKPFYRLAEGGAALATVATDQSVAIAPMEGVFVCADGTETVSFTKAPTTSTTDGRNLLSMRVSRNRNSKDDSVDTDNAIVRFGEGDMLRKLVLNPDLSQLYVAQDGTDYAIVNAEAEGELPVSFRAATNGSYTFSVATEEVEMNYLHLIDHKTGADVDLLQTPSYTFEASTADYECRFTLVFARGASTTDDTFAYYNGSQWVVSSEADATLQVIDVMGRVLSSQNINGNAEVSIDRAAGVYLLRLINGSDVKVQKIVIQ